MLRDSLRCRAKRLTTVRPAPCYVGELLDRILSPPPKLEDDDDLRPRSAAQLAEEVRAVLARHDTRRPSRRPAPCADVRSCGRPSAASRPEHHRADRAEPHRHHLGAGRLVLASVRRASADRSGRRPEFAVIGMGHTGSGSSASGPTPTSAQRPGTGSRATPSFYAQPVSELVRLLPRTHMPPWTRRDLRPEWGRTARSCARSTPTEAPITRAGH